MVLLIVFAGATLVGSQIGVVVLGPIAIERFSSSDLSQADEQEFEREVACLTGGGGWIVNRYEDAITGETRLRDFTRQRLSFVCLMPHQLDPAGP